jgi:hypothetical protein
MERTVILSVRLSFLDNPEKIQAEPFVASA